VKKQERVLEVPVSFVRRFRLEEKTCPQCGKKFEGVKKRKYCSRACQAKADYERHADEYRKARVEKYRSAKNAETRK
jgi:endogenous inhibitor of DNA gyrase (YacG/DUF329 family)